MCCVTRNANQLGFDTIGVVMDIGAPTRTVLNKYVMGLALRL